MHSFGKCGCMVKRIKDLHSGGYSYGTCCNCSELLQPALMLSACESDTPPCVVPGKSTDMSIKGHLLLEACTSSQ